MNWAALVTLLLEFFGPYIKKWFENIFAKAQAKMTDDLPTVEPQVGIEKLFSEARKEVGFLRFRKRSALAVCERIAKNRAYEFWNALKGDSPKPKMTLQERNEIDSL